MKSVFTDKNRKPADQELKKAIGTTYPLWQRFAAYAMKREPMATADWHFSGDKYGWSYRISDKKRVVVYLLPRDGFFKVAFVFGQKAVDAINASDIAEHIKTEINTAKPYAEGRGVRLDITDGSLASDIEQLITIKIAQ